MVATPVLIVDDSPMIVKIIQKALLANIIDGYHFDEKNIYTASDGMEAFSTMGAKHNIKLIISDINMPNLNGDEFIEILQDTGKLKELQVVFVTSSSTKLILSYAVKENILGIIYKPFRYDSFAKQLQELQKQKSLQNIELQKIKERQIEKKKFVEKICLIYLEDLDLEWVSDTLEILIDETFSNDEISQEEYLDITYSVLSTYLFEVNIQHSINAKKISCILKRNTNKVEFNKNRFHFIDGFKSQIQYVNSQDLQLKETLQEIITPLFDKVSMATSQVKKYKKLNTKLYAPYFEYIIEEFVKLDCDFLDVKLEKLILEQKEVAKFLQYLHEYINKNEVKTNINAVSKSEALGIELTKRLNKILNNTFALSRHYCGNIEFYIWKRARESSEIYGYLKKNMPKTIPCTPKFLLHKKKITKMEYQHYLPYEKQKVLVLSNSLETLGLFKGEVNEHFGKWNFFCFAKTSLLEAWLNSNIADKVIIDYNFKAFEFENGLEFLKSALKIYPIFKDIVSLDQLYIIAKEKDYEELKKYKSNYNFSIMQEPLTTNRIYDNLLYD
jgi:CheY-like chemotaxis protein